MNFLFLGTSAGRPTKERNVSALALTMENEHGWYLFDCGEATQHQILKTSLKNGRLKSIFITHLHGDHYYGLLGLIDSFKMDNRRDDLFIYAPKGLRDFLECTMDISLKKLGFKLEIIEFKEYDEYEFEKFSIKILPLYHSVDSFAFFIKEYDKSNSLDEEKLKRDGLLPSYLYGELKKGKEVWQNGRCYKPKDYFLDIKKGRRVIICGDNAKPEILKDYLKGIDLLIHEATYTKEVYKNLPVKVLHSIAYDVGKTANESNVKNLIITHISPRYHDNGKFPLKLLEDEIRQNYKGRFFIAEDLQSYRLDHSGALKMEIL
jgi:ribonuclease Z